MSSATWHLMWDWGTHLEYRQIAVCWCEKAQIFRFRDILCAIYWYTESIVTGR